MEECWEMMDGRGGVGVGAVLRVEAKPSDTKRRGSKGTQKVGRADGITTALCKLPDERVPLRWVLLKEYGGVVRFPADDAEGGGGQGWVWHVRYPVQKLARTMS